MKMILAALGIRPTSVGLATLQTKSDIITAALERDRALRSLDSGWVSSHEPHDRWDFELSEAV